MIDTLCNAFTPDRVAIWDAATAGLALKSGNARGAVKILIDANATLDTWLGHFDLGRSYLAAGALTQADSEFDRCIRRTRRKPTDRERLQARLQDARYGGVLIALVLGDQRAITEEDWLLFNRTGVSHLVSISGLHITMIAGLVALAVGAIWRRSARALAIAPAQFAAAIAAMLGAQVGLSGGGCPLRSGLACLR